MSRPVTQLTRIACLFLAFGCASPEELKSPPASNGGQSSTSVGGAEGTGGSSATPNTDVGMGGSDMATGGRQGQGGAKASGGHVSVGGGDAAGGSGSTAPAAAIKMAWTRQGNNAPEIHLTPVSGAEPILVSRIKLTYCGAGAGQMITNKDLNFTDARLICPSDVSTGDCTYGASYQVTPATTVSGTPRDCCYNVTFGNVAHSLVAGTQSMIKLVYNFEQTAVGINYTYESTWTVYVDDVAAMHCTLGEWVPTGAAPITCGT